MKISSEANAEATAKRREGRGFPRAGRARDFPRAKPEGNPSFWLCPGSPKMPLNVSELGLNII